MTPIWLSRSLAVAPWLSSWFGVLLIVLPLLGAFLSGCAASEPSDNQTHASDRATALPVASLRLEHRSSYTLKRSFVGRVEPARESRLGFELGGLLRVVQVDEGDSVKKGQMLAQLDVARLTARRQELQAALEEARANLALASITVRRLEGVVEAGGVSRQGLD